MTCVAKAGPGIDRSTAIAPAIPREARARPDQVVRYLLADNIGYDCYYIGWRGLTVDRILRERDLRARLEVVS